METRHTTGPAPAPDPGPHVREMTDEDCEAVAAIRVGGWQSAYLGLMPQPYLDAMDVGRETEIRRERLAAGGAVNLVAVTGPPGQPAPEVVGWACYGAYREDDGRRTEGGELYTLYVRPDRTGTGTGGALLAEVMARAAGDGFPTLALWVLRENTGARRFYERAGFAPDGAEEDFDAGGLMVPEVRYVTALTPPAAGTP
ncbi:GNAT family N-acetyltransferase [Streptomyces sp. NBC_00102]|uniref:GNAT family N-acetyltransferase n=1 Tax=Streptomyces sp. NBC_00102 TaxID=2975652 RepID=UPI00225866A0|nr:GNAT family N-acetyltransferase [Streptomyces sp. NBC_00102]MCX5400906.1 GNAT family N-acetyltransferase [Streptomyces sp. NBC_00102]